MKTARTAVTYASWAVVMYVCITGTIDSAKEIKKTYREYKELKKELKKQS